MTRAAAVLLGDAVYTRALGIAGLAVMLAGDTDKYSHPDYLATSFANNTAFLERLNNASPEQLQAMGIHTQQDFRDAVKGACDELNRVSEEASLIASNAAIDGADGSTHAPIPIVQCTGTADASGRMAVTLPDGKGHLEIYPASDQNGSLIEVYPAADGKRSSNVIITPILEDGQMRPLPLPITPSKGWHELIIVSPAGSGLPPMHVVYSESTTDKQPTTVVNHLDGQTERQASAEAKRTAPQAVAGNAAKPVNSAAGLAAAKGTGETAAAGVTAAAQRGTVTNTGHITIDSKIAGQLRARGWTKQEVQTAIDEGPVGTTTDSRSAAKTPDGVPRNDPASVYGSKSGYVVVNDRTGEVVQVSGKNDPGWIPDSRINWK